MSARRVEPARRAGARPPGARRATLATLALATLATLGALGAPALGKAPVVGVHYEDLEPGRAEAVIAFLDPGFPGWGAVSVQAADPCLEVGEPYNTQWDVWRIPARLLDPHGCVTSVLVTLSRGAEAWEGAVLVALNPVSAAAPLGEGLLLSVDDYAAAEPGSASAPSRPPRHLELTFRNEAGAPVTVLALSAGAAFDAFFGPVYERSGDEDGETRDPVRFAPHLGWGRTIPPGGAATLGATVDGLAHLTAERNAWTLALLPLVEVGGERYYVPTASLTAFEYGSAP